MASHKAVAFLLVLIAVSAAFNVSDYLYPSEQNATVAYTNFTVNGTAYSLVTIGGQNAFLLSGGEPVTNQSTIEPALYSYYVQKYYPSQSDIQGLKDLIQKFNNSRNDGYDFKNKEEYTCRDDILLSDGKITISGKPVICKDNASCTENAMLLFSIYGQGLNLGGPDALLQPLMDFTPTSLQMDALLINYTVRLDNLTDSTLADTLNYISSTSGSLKPMALKIESTIFRTPRLNDTADRAACQLKCYAICPSLSLDKDAAQAIHDQSASMASKIGPLNGYQAAAAQIYNSTASRINHVQTEGLASYYLDKFAPLNASASDAISLGDEALSHVQNRTLSSKLDELKSLHTTIPQDINARNFTTLDADLARYESLISVVENASTAALDAYNKTKNAKSVENSLILVLQSKDLDPVSMKSLELLMNDTSDVDAQFHDGLTVQQLADVEQNYSNLTSRAQEILKTESDTPATRVILLFRGFARKVNTGIAEAAEKSSVVAPSNIPSTPIYLGAFSALFFLSSGSIVLLVFLHIFSANRFRIPKTGQILGVTFIALIMLLLVFSVFMYLFLGKTSTDATLPEFLADFSSKNSTSIIVDLRNTSFSDSQAMKACAGSLADSFSQKNKTWSLYTLTSSSCVRSMKSGSNTTLTATECQNGIDSAQSSFVLGYSPSNDQPPRFSVIYQNKAEIKANLDYYQSCPLVALFS